MDGLWRIARVPVVEAGHDPRFKWPWPAEHQAQITANWQRRIAATPKMFNGRILMLSALDLAPDICRSTYFAADYADFVAWLDFDHPDRNVGNGFAMGALRGSDGGYICGVMADHTANAGRIYFAAGTPDEFDLRQDGTVDLASSLTRELVEETGLDACDYDISPDWIVVQHWPVVAMLRHLTLKVPADEGVARIRSFLSRQAEPELKDLRIVRCVEDIDERAMPPFLQSFFRWSFDQR